MNLVNRKRHIVDFHEGFHRFIHSEDIVICNTYGYSSYVGFGNCLYNIKTRLKDIINYEDPYLYYTDSYTKCIAVIDRENKRICVSDKYYYIYYLINTVPDDWEITYVNSFTKNFYFLSKLPNYAFCKSVCEYIIKKFVNTYAEEYAVLYKYKQTINKNVRIPIINTECQNIIKLLLNKYNLTAFWFYKEAIIDNIYVRYSQGWNNKYFSLTKIPTIEKIYKHKVFSKNEGTYIIQRKFYTDFCRGCGVSFNDVVKHWNDKDGISVLNVNIKDTYHHLYPTWKEAIKLNANYKDNQDELFIKYANKQSINNRKQAIINHINIDEVKNIINAWREDNIKIPFTITYKKYIVTNNSMKGRYICGKWIDTTEVVVSIPFDYIQLKYDDNKDMIKTSKGSEVKLVDAIYLWNLYKKIVKEQNLNTDNPSQYIDIHLDNKNFKCGIYPITGIYHNLKYINNDKTEYYCWNVVVGCHTIWLDDFIDFVKYYNLQKYFND